MQSLTRMNTNWAAENIQTIRTLMERATIYRRALAPVMTFAGVVGIAAAYAGERMNIHASHAFARYWMVISTIAVAGVGVLVISTDLDELLALCHRIVVLHRGALVGELAGEQLVGDAVRLKLSAWMTGLGEVAA